MTVLKNPNKTQKNRFEVGFFRWDFLGFIGRVFLLPTLDPCGYGPTTLDADLLSYKKWQCEVGLKRTVPRKNVYLPVPSNEVTSSCDIKVSA
jgi:hypothetical protein